MAEIIKARAEHVEGIADVCSKAYRSTYRDSYPEEYIERVIRQFYNKPRILEEVTDTGKEWGGYFVAIKNGIIIGAGAGGMTAEKVGELFVLYMHPERRNEGYGFKILEAVTRQQKEDYGAVEQWVSVAKGNDKGIPFYEARGFTFQYEQPVYGSREGEDYISLRYKRYL